MTSKTASLRIWVRHILILQRGEKKHNNNRTTVKTQQYEIGLTLYQTT